MDPSLQRSFLSELSSTYRRIHSSQGSLFLVFSSFCFSFYEESVYSLYLPVHQVKSHVTFPGSIFTRFLTNLSFSKIFRTGLVLLENHQRDSYYSLNLFFLFFHFWFNNVSCTLLLWISHQVFYTCLCTTCKIVSETTKELCVAKQHRDVINYERMWKPKHICTLVCNPLQGHRLVSCLQKEETIFF